MKLCFAKGFWNLFLNYFWPFVVSVPGRKDWPNKKRYKKVPSLCPFQLWLEQSKMCMYSNFSLPCHKISRQGYSINLIPIILQNPKQLFNILKIAKELAFFLESALSGIALSESWSLSGTEPSRHESCPGQRWIPWTAFCIYGNFLRIILPWGSLKG